MMHKSEKETLVLFTTFFPSSHNMRLFVELNQRVDSVSDQSINVGS